MKDDKPKVLWASSKTIKTKKPKTNQPVFFTVPDKGTYRNGSNILKRMNRRASVLARKAARKKR